MMIYIVLIVFIILYYIILYSMKHIYTLTTEIFDYNSM
jgi:hypothetical protein